MALPDEVLPKTFSIECGVMQTSSGIDFIVTLENSDRPKDANLFDEIGRRSVFITRNAYDAVCGAREWGEFLGVKVDVSIFVPYVDKQYLRCTGCKLISCTCGKEDFYII